jgi:hypothetical protein
LPEGDALSGDDDRVEPTRDIEIVGMEGEIERVLSKGPLIES